MINGKLNKKQKKVLLITFIISMVAFIIIFIFKLSIYLGFIALFVHLTAFQFFK